MPPKHFKSLSLPDSTYEGIQRARADLQQRGLAAIPPELLDPPACPSCGGHVEHVTVGIQHIKCHGCGYAQQTVSATGNALVPFATGALVGAAVAALFMVMAREEKPARAALRAKRHARKTTAKKRAARGAR